MIIIIIIIIIILLFFDKSDHTLPKANGVRGSFFRTEEIWETPFSSKRK